MKKDKYMIITRALTHGGAEKTAINLANTLSQTRDVILVTLNSDRATYKVETPMVSLNMNVHEKGNKILWYYNLLKKVNRLKKEHKVTCTISFLLEPDIANVFSWYKDTKIISIRNKQSELFKGSLRKIRDKLVFTKADKIVAISKMVRKDLIDNYSVPTNKISTIYNFSNKKSIQKSIIKTTISEHKQIDFENDLVAINVGRLTKQKGQWHLIRAFTKVVEQVPNAKLIILGEGELNNYLSELIEQLKLKDNVFLLGYQENPYEFINKSKVFIFSSLFEGLGNSIIESLVCGTPVISTDCDSGPREILAPETNVYETGSAKGILYGKFGILVPTLDGELYNATDQITQEELILSQSIVSLFKNDELYNEYKKSSYVRVKDFDDDKIISQWIELLEGE